jgi:hypothetical protein
MPYRLFIDPLPPAFTSADLAALLRLFWKVISAEIVYDTLGYSLRFGRAEIHTRTGRGQRRETAPRESLSRGNHDCPSH